MNAPTFRTGPALVAADSSLANEHQEIATASTANVVTDNTAGDRPQESALQVLQKAWQRCGHADRAKFLADIRAGSPNIWRKVQREAGGRRP